MQRPHGREVGCPLRGGGSGAARSVVEAEAESVTAAAAASPDDRGAAAVTDDGGRDRRGARSAALDRVAVVEADWFGQALAAPTARGAQTPPATARPRARSPR